MTLNRRQTLKMGGAALAALHPLALRAQAPAPRVVASFSILADMARELAPAGVQVTALVGPNADAHVYAPSPADGKRLAEADLVLINGLGFEGWIERMVKISGYRGTVAVASQGIQARTGGHHGTDPHAWQDLTLARRYASNISAAFIQRWPAQRDEIARRDADYGGRIGSLDRQVREWLSVVPRAQRRVITSHDAFGYFGAAYGVDFLAPQGWTTHSEPSAAAVARLIRQIRKDGVRAIFIENISDPRLVERIASEAGVRIGGTLYSDALSKPDGPAPTYLRLIEHNARSLAAALQA
ncbi:MAG: zinc ABC transporter substrate-binding protein [Burkholderiales bacterium]|jgi:zinc/manganese transport system substrate-binding protein|nr:zinc ABC transporter substrate-binding protein [Burkholderiales bacterium]MCA3229088.1 zinc ABC transporter substrate-binding protein [Burkholderiales bacterium]